MSKPSQQARTGAPLLGCGDAAATQTSITGQVCAAATGPGQRE
jgi:hypothetical protein